MRIANLTDQTSTTLTDEQSRAISKAADIYVRTIQRTMAPVTAGLPDHTIIQAVMVSAVAASIKVCLRLGAPKLRPEFTDAEAWETAVKAVVNGTTAAAAGCAQGLQVWSMGDELCDEARRLFVEAFDLTNRTLRLANADMAGNA